MCSLSLERESLTGIIGWQTVDAVFQEFRHSEAIFIFPHLCAVLFESMRYKHVAYLIRRKCVNSCTMCQSLRKCENRQSGSQGSIDTSAFLAILLIHRPILFAWVPRAKMTCAIAISNNQLCNNGTKFRGIKEVSTCEDSFRNPITYFIIERKIFLMV